MGACEGEICEEGAYDEKYQPEEFFSRRQSETSFLTHVSIAFLQDFYIDCERLF